MEQQYIIAQNALTVKVPDGVTAWEGIESRFSPFSVEGSSLETLFAVDIQVGELPTVNGELIYEPETSGIGFIVARAYRQHDESLLMEFIDVNDGSIHLTMTMPAALNEADITLAANGDPKDTYFLAHALMMAYMLATADNGTLLIHSATVIYQGEAYLFQGRSGTGKSTHAALWVKNIEGAELLNDDNPVIRFSEGKANVFGSPWSGKTHCYRNLSAPVGAFVRIVRDSENQLVPLSPLKGYASLTTSVLYLPFVSKHARDIRHSLIERLVTQIPCYEMHCRPDAEAALTCQRQVSELRN